MSVDDEWSTFIYSLNHESEGISNTDIFKSDKLNETEPNIDIIVPNCDELYISTKTKVLNFNQPIDIHTIFWKLPIIKHSMQCNGIVKKQMKIISLTVDELNEYMKKLENVEYYTENVIKSINNPDARRNKFKDERKLTIGISKKDIMNCRGKVKNAFYNCFAIVIRFLYENNYREIHVKIFNTGKIEMPGILNVEIFNTVKELLLKYIQSFMSTTSQLLTYINEDNETNVLINSNFNCGYYINRDLLYGILSSSKYGIETAYEPCSYPGIKCKFYFNNEIGLNESLQTGQVLQEDRNITIRELNHLKKYTEVSFMIFRTGSCLIVGNCTEIILRFIYRYLKRVLHNEFMNISVKCDKPISIVKNIKPRKRTISMTFEYYKQHVYVN